jgi:hypothetical protein
LLRVAELDAFESLRGRADYQALRAGLKGKD